MLYAFIRGYEAECCCTCHIYVSMRSQLPVGHTAVDVDVDCGFGRTIAEQNDDPLQNGDGFGLLSPVSAFDRLDLLASVCSGSTAASSSSCCSRLISTSVGRTFLSTVCSAMPSAIENFELHPQTSLPD